MEEIDIIKSAKSLRIRYILNFKNIINIIVDYALWILLIIISPLIYIEEGKHSNDLSLSLTLILLMVYIWLILGLWFLDKLVLVELKNNTHNKRIIITYINKRYPKLEINYINTNHISFSRDSGWFNWGREIIVIFDDNKMYLNCSSLARHNMRWPFSSPLNYLMMKRIKNDLENNR